MSGIRKLSITALACILLALFPLAVFAQPSEKHTVSFDSRGGSVVADVTVQDGACVAQPEDPLYSGHTFRGWYKETGYINEWDFTRDTVTEDVTLYAKWERLYNITAVSSDTSLGKVSGGGEYAKGTAVTVSAVPDTGCRFAGWLETGETTAVVALTVSQDVVLTAGFERIEKPALLAYSSGYDSVSVYWSEVMGATGYEIYRYFESKQEYYKLANVDSAGALTYTEQGLETGNTYNYKVRALCECGTAITYGGLSENAAASPTLDIPQAQAAPGGYRSIKVSWTLVPGAYGYEVQRSASPEGGFETVYTYPYGDGTGYTDMELEDGAAYYYRVRAYRTSRGTAHYSDYSDTASAQALFLTPELCAASASQSSVYLSWNMLWGAAGYDILRSDSESGEYEKIYTATSASTAHYTDTRLESGRTYYYTMCAFGRDGSEKVYGQCSMPVSCVPSTSMPQRTFTVLYQGDPKWGFSQDVKKNACLMCAYSILIDNMDINATPRTVFKENGNATYIKLDVLKDAFGVKPVCALNPCSPYLRGFNGWATYVKSPAKNGTAAIKEALNEHPEGVICYFKKGEEAHAIVACKYDGDTIYFSDPGRKRTTLLTFGNTWVKYRHKMGYGNLYYIVTLDKTVPQ